MNSVDKRCRDWPYNWFGYFRVSLDTTSHESVPPMSDFVDSKWTHPRKPEILAYLRQSFYGGLPTAPSSCRCPYCDALIPAAVWHWDGEWHWPAFLLHYVEAHGVRLPDRMVRHIEERAFRAPQAIPHVAYEDLPMPPPPRGSSGTSWLRSLLGRGGHAT
jgi:hypothetical protein